MQTIKTGLQQAFSRSTWRRWREALRQCEAAFESTEVDLPEGRLRTLEAQVLELRQHLKKP